ncbi:TIM44-related membrane protein TimA [Brevundimonas sp.]|uniref:TIM44-related membrane protein TimA n=1 Tax=Brevundimonas sp. TaxID=1871086 RepID=UPI002D28DE5B|nr:TIM44-related membrane protein TimA [Brevundimonas sp.]HYC68516.1 TIM44-related membrane protein TimA [Brevundimonas sp.]
MPVPVQVQIVIFAVIAAIVLFQLYNVLGKKVGRQPEDDARAQPPAPAPAAAAETGGARPNILDAATLASIAGLKARDPAFDPVRFLEGARQAHETIVRAYAAGDRETLKPLLTPRVMDSFEAGIAAREARGETEEAEFLHPARADLELATAEDNRALAKVRFLAELRNRVTPAEPGADEQVEERRVAEVWTFERILGASDPNWLLARTEPATA